MNSSEKQLEVLMHLEASTSEMLPISQCRKCKAKKKLFLEPARVRSHGRPGDAVLEKRETAASNAAPPKEGGITAQVHQSLAPALS